MNIWHHFSYLSLKSVMLKIGIWPFIIMTISSLIFYTILVYLKKTSFSKLKYLLCIHANKSDTSAVLLGGLPLNIIFTSFLCYYIFFVNDPHPTQLGDHFIFSYAVISLLAILFYGYLDDRIEIKPMVKIFSQIVSLTIFSLFSSKWVYFDHSSLAFLAIFVFGIVLINGVNLIDGIDELSYKMAISTCFHITLVSFFTGEIHLAPSLALALFCSLGGFVLFNRYPSKIHLGEIGTSTLGFCFIFISTIVYRDFKYKLGDFNSFCFILIPLSYYLCETSVSFLRRVLNKKSPFKGDRLHLHHILREDYGLTPKQVSWALAGVHFVTTLIGLTLTFFVPSLVALIIQNILLISAMFAIGRNRWFPGYRSMFKAQDLYDLLAKKDVNVISEDLFNTLEITVIKNPVNAKTSKKISNNKKPKKVA